MRLKVPDNLIGRIIASLVIGFGLPVLLIGILLVRSQGNEPQGMCERIQGDGGTLPIDMSRGGDVYYTCGLNWDYVAFNLALPALGFALLAYILMVLLRRTA
ncbi:hypothetical protein [uncultured Ferrovibrio sp.]|uniref:hypothetical protein n=1 Tax=uncultured Ferrovibrio sp. TaxID=1576913 RepID=UPI002624A350|nr:hypothetical protein [uncultured Ferrovibrio sp.]